MHAKPLSYWVHAGLVLGGLMGAGLFVGIGTAIATTGRLILISYAIAGTAMLVLLHLAYQMRSLYPGSYLITDHVRLALGVWPGRLARCMYWGFWGVLIALEAIAGSNILAPEGGLPKVGFGIGLIVGSAFSGNRTSRFLAYFEIPFSFVKVAIVITFIAILLNHISHAYHNDLGAIARRATHSVRRGGPVLPGVILAMFSLGGLEVLHGAACETERRSRPVANTIWLITFRVVALYMVPIGVILAVIDSGEIRPGVSPFTTSLESIGHNAIAKCFDVVVLTSVVVALHVALSAAAQVFASSMKDSVQGRIGASRGSSLPRGLRWRPAVTAVVITVIGAVVTGVSYPFLVEVAGMLLVATYGLFTSAVYRASSIELCISPLIGGGPSSSRSISLALTMGFFTLLLSMVFIQSLTAPFLSVVALLLVIACGFALANRSSDARGVVRED